jgi:PhzF family phenazine biosynthesis protein
MTQLKPTFGKTIEDRAALAAAIGVNSDQLAAAAPQEVNCGSTFLIVPLATRKAVDAAVLDRAKLDAVLTSAGIQRRGVYVFSTEPSGSASLSREREAYSRLLGSGGIEDPATGSAAGPAASFVVRYKMLGDGAAHDIAFLQGVLVRRPSRIHVRVGGTPENITSVQVGGSAVVVGEGTMRP